MMVGESWVYSALMIPCCMANLTRDGMSWIPSFCISLDR